MAEYTSISTHFYEDGYIQSLPPTDKFLFLYLIGGPQSEPTLGIYELSLNTMAHHTGLLKENIEHSLSRFAETDKIHYVDGWVVLKNHFKHNPLRGNERLVKGALTRFNRVPWHVHDRVLNADDTLYIPYLDPSHSLYIGSPTKNIALQPVPARPFPIPTLSQSPGGMNTPVSDGSKNLETERKRLAQRKSM